MFKYFFNCLTIFLILLHLCQGIDQGCYQLQDDEEICFFKSLIDQTFKDSLQFCKNNGGFLLEIYDAKMQDYVEWFIKRKTSDTRYSWLNLNRRNGQWFWGDNVNSAKYLGYSNWDIFNPNVYGNDIALMTANLKWTNDYTPSSSIATASAICIEGTRTNYIRSTTTSSNKIGIGGGVGGLGGLLIIIVSFFLIAKFGFNKNIPCCSNNQVHHSDTGSIDNVITRNKVFNGKLKSSRNNMSNRIHESRMTNVISPPITAPESGLHFIQLAHQNPPNYSNSAPIGFEAIEYFTKANGKK